jgi:predicted ATP-dependent endonuclease of OLD family
MPTLTNIAIENYRGFYGRREIAPAIPTGARGSGLTILVGPNNSGKSTVVAALRLVTGEPKQIDLEHRHPDARLAITLTNSEGVQKTITNPDLGATTVIQGEAIAYPTSENIRLVPSRRAWSAYTGQQRMDVQQYWDRAKEQQAEDNFLISRLAALTGAQRDAYNVLLKELLPELSSWRIELSRGQTFVLYKTKSGAQHAADLFGDGMASLFRLSLALFDSSNTQVIVVDEPELSLHPQAQKTLASVLSRYAADRQVIITSHSPYFVSWADLANGTKVYRLTQKQDGIAVGSLDPETMADLKGLTDDWQKPNLLDAVSREIFFADEVLFVEGQEDVGLLRKFCNDKNLSQMAIFGYGAGGFGNIKHFLQMAEDLGIQAAAIYDGDHADAKDEAAGFYPDALVELLPTPDIRDKPARDDQGKETDKIQKLGIFDRAGVIKPEHETYLVELLEKIRAFLKIN